MHVKLHKDAMARRKDSVPHPTGYENASMDREQCVQEQHAKLQMQRSGDLKASLQRDDIVAPHPHRAVPGSAVGPASPGAHKAAVTSTRQLPHQSLPSPKKPCSQFFQKSPPSGASIHEQQEGVLHGNHSGGSLQGHFAHLPHAALAVK